MIRHGDALDLDGMKQINDRHGHLVGNRALSRLAGVLMSCARTIDTAARFGGDEFSMLLLETDGVAAQQVARRISERLVADQEVPPLRVGIGISSYPGDGETNESLLEAADSALYQIKRGGSRAVTEESLS
jgi:diguanylate cyclase (GGDEF)-like protein